MYNYELGLKRIKRGLSKNNNYKIEINNIVAFKINSYYELISEEINKIFDDLNISKKIFLGDKIYFIIKDEPLDIFLRMIDLNTLIKIANERNNLNIFVTQIFINNFDFVINNISIKALNELNIIFNENTKGIYLNKYAYRKIIKNPKNSRLWFNEINGFYKCDIVFEKIC